MPLTLPCGMKFICVSNTSPYGLFIGNFPRLVRMAKRWFGGIIRRASTDVRIQQQEEGLVLPHVASGLGTGARGAALLEH